ncbi:MAG: glycerophosphodiester phosphodiesterase family protein [Caldilineaceae bacterium]
MGVDMLEMDVHASADGVLVVRHDDTVDSTTNGQGEVRTKTLAELKALDAGYRWTDDDGATFPFRGQGITIPTLEEVFAALPDMPMTIEIKQADPSITQPLCDLIRRYNKTDQVIVGSFHNHALDDFRRICPEVATSGHEGDVRVCLSVSGAIGELVFTASGSVAGAATQWQHRDCHLTHGPQRPQSRPQRTGMDNQ